MADLEKAQAELQELLGRQEELDPELEPYRETMREGFDVVRHPLVYSMLHVDSMNGWVNEALRQKKELVAKAARAGKWEHYVWLHERPYRVEAFSNICWHLGDKRFWTLLGHLYTDTENLWQQQPTWESLLTCGRRYRSYLMNEEERDQFREVLPAEITVYRGYTEEGTVEGLSWSTNPIVAKFFANRYRTGQPGFIATGTVRKRDVIAYFEGRSEYEVVTLPGSVQGIEVREITEEEE